MRRVAGQPIEVLERHVAPPPVRTLDLHIGPQRLHGDGHVGRVRGDAVLGPAEDGVDAVDPAERAAAGAGRPLVAGHGRVGEVVAPGALEEVAARRRLVAQLARRARQEGAGEDGVVAAHRPVGREVGIGHERADP